MKRILLGGLVSLIFSLGTAQEKSPEFRQPMDIPVALSANFGELRANHFHSGLDLKTQQVCGQKVYAVQDGYVSRIHVSATGYGNCLYIDHPSGYTSVYAHLDRFLPFIDSIAKREQYARESFALDYYPEAGSIPVKKGQLIAYSGNSGSSGGPHLHFEIRETATQKAMDPQQFYQIYDNLAPKFKKIRLQPVAGEGVVRGQGIAQTYGAQLRDNGWYGLSKDTIEAWGRIGMEVKSYDYMPGQSNIYGVYHLWVEVDGLPVFEYCNDGFLFSETRMINAFIDYPAWYQKNDVFMRTYLLPGNGLPLYKQVEDDGYLMVNEERCYEVKVFATDRQGNVSKLRFVLKGRKQLVPVVHVVTNANKMYRDMPASYANNDVELQIPAGSLYDDIYFHYDVRADSLGYSDIHQLDKATVPLQTAATVKIRLKNDTLADKSKYYIARNGRKGGYDFVGNTYENGFLSGTTRNLGTFRIRCDTIPPVVRLLSRGESVRVKITDVASGIATYRGMVDGKWALFAYDAKTMTLKYTFDPKRVQRGREHPVEVTVRDMCGNESTLAFMAYW